MQDVPPTEADRPVRLPQIVPIVLHQTARFLSDGQFTQADFEEKLARLAAEELTPRGLELLVRNLADSTIRFLIKDSRTGCTCEMIDCGRKSSAADESRQTETAPVRAAMTAPLIAWEAHK